MQGKGLKHDRGLTISASGKRGPTRRPPLSEPAPTSASTAHSTPLTVGTSSANSCSVESRPPAKSSRMLWMDQPTVDLRRKFDTSCGRYLRNVMAIFT